MAALFGADKLVDCSPMITGDTFGFMNVPYVGTDVTTVANDGYLKTIFNLGCDVGSHIDSPYHFFDPARSVGEIELEQLVARGAVFDLTDKTNATLYGNYGLSVQDILEWEEKYGQIPDGAIVVMKTGWNQYFDDRQLYTGLGADPNEPNLFQFPGFLPEAAEWLLDNRNIKGLGVDSASLDVGTSTDYLVH